MEANRRVAERLATMGLMSSIWDGKSACIGVIEDVSATGLRVSQIPLHFGYRAEKYTSIVHGPNRDYKIQLQPCWKVETNSGMYKMIGFRIDNPSTPWKEFVLKSRDPVRLLQHKA